MRRNAHDRDQSQPIKRMLAGRDVPSQRDRKRIRVPWCMTQCVQPESRDKESAADISEIVVWKFLDTFLRYWMDFRDHNLDRTSLFDH